MSKKKLLVCLAICVTLPVTAFLLTFAVIKAQAAFPLEPTSRDELKVQSFLLQEDLESISNAQKLNANPNDVRSWWSFFSFNDEQELISINYTAELYGTLDVSGCTALKSIYANSMQGGSSSIGTPGKCLTGINITGCTALEELDCNGNLLTSLNTGTNKKLKTLLCERNKLTSLDILQNTEITRLNCITNELTALDISKNTKLTELYCSSNQLSVLDISNNTALTDLRCFDNKLTKLDTSNCHKIKNIECYGNPNLKYINVSGNTSESCTVASKNPSPSINLVQSPLNKNGTGRLRNPNIISFILFPYSESSSTHVTAEVTISSTPYNLTQTLTVIGTVPTHIFAQAHKDFATPSFICWLDESYDPITAIGSGAAFDNETDLMLAFPEHGNTDPVYAAINYENLLGATRPSIDRYIVGIGAELENPGSLEGYTFLGWYDRLEGGNKFESISSTASGDKVFYARWQTNAPKETPPKSPDDKNTPLVVSGIVLVICLVFVMNYLFNTRSRRR